MSDDEKWLVCVMALMVAIWWLFLRCKHKPRRVQEAPATLADVTVSGGGGGCCCAGL